MNKEDRILSELQAKLDKEMEVINLTPREDFDYLSRADLQNILYGTFDEVSPIGFRNKIDSAILEHVPFLKLSVEYLKILKDLGTVKLTKRGNLPRKICFELYETGIIKEDFIEKGFIKLNKEGDTVAIQNVKIIGLLSGLTKKRKNEISLTSKGEKLLQDESGSDLLELIFRTNCQKFNLGYHDGYPQNVGIQDTFGFTLYLFLRYGSERRKVEFYTEKILTAFPILASHFEERWTSREDQFKGCYEVRVLERFLKYYNFIEYENKRSPLSSREPLDVKTTGVFREIFELKVDRFKFKKSGHWA